MWEDNTLKVNRAIYSASIRLWEASKKADGSPQVCSFECFQSASCPSLPETLHFITILFQQDLCCVLNISNTLESECQKPLFIRLGHWTSCSGQGLYINPFTYRPLFILYKLLKAGVNSRVCSECELVQQNKVSSATRAYCFKAINEEKTRTSFNNMFI